MFPLVLACREARRVSSVYHEAVMDLEEPLVLVALGIFLLVVFLDAYAFKISSEHVAVLEVVVRGTFVVGTWLFEHFVENALARGPLRFLAISSNNKVIGQGLKLALLVLLLLPVVPLRASAGAHGILLLVLPLVLITTKDGTNRLTGGEVGDDIHQTVGSDGSVAAQLSDQLFVGGIERKAMMTSESVMLGSSVRCLEKHRM
jgi:hypothetical protein